MYGYLNMFGICERIDVIVIVIVMSCADVMLSTKVVSVL